MHNKEENIRSLKEKFARLINRLSNDNRKGTKRHEFEVEFCYAMYELEVGPPYLEGKLFETVIEICNNLAHQIKDPETV